MSAPVFRSAPPHDVSGDTLVLPLTGPGTDAALDRLCEDREQLLRSVLRASSGPCHVVPALGRLACETVVLVDIDGDLREAARSAGHRCRSAGRLVVGLTAAAEASAEAVAHVAEGLVVGLGGTPADVQLADPRLAPGGDVDAAVRRGAIVGDSVNWARALVDTPPGDLFPLAFAERIAERARRVGVECVIRQLAELEALRLGALVTVGGASADPPCLVELSYAGGPGAPVTLVGKGLTFDTGGLHLKGFDDMATMKRDMAGAAAVAAAVLAAAELGLSQPVTALLPLAENATGPGALRPGDVVRHRNGLTSEVISPDAEGRLVLADCLALAAERSPSALIDVGTLTDGGGLGPEHWAVMGNDPALTAALLAAATRAGDHGWELPLVPSYERLLASDVANLRNLGLPTRYKVDTLLVAVFLSRFVGDLPWAHLDISAVAARDRSCATPGRPEGATGSPAPALIAWLQGLAAA